MKNANALGWLSDRLFELAGAVEDSPDLPDCPDLYKAKAKNLVETFASFVSCVDEEEGVWNPETFSGLAFGIERDLTADVNRESLSEDITYEFVASHASADDIVDDIKEATGCVVDPDQEDLLKDLTNDDLRKLLHHVRNRPTVAERHILQDRVTKAIARLADKELADKIRKATGKEPGSDQESRFQNLSVEDLQKLLHHIRTQG